MRIPPGFPVLLAAPLLWTSAGAIGIAHGPASDPGGVQIDVVAGAYIVAPVRIAGSGPYRMLVDTGTTVTQLAPALALSLNLHASDRLVLSGPAGDRTAARVHVPLTLASASVERLEAVVCDVGPAGARGAIDGILGQNFLEAFDYAIDYRSRRLWIGDAAWKAPRASRAALPLDFDDGRPVVTAEIGTSRTVRLVLDSGASDLVLFHEAASLARTPGIVLSGTAELLTPTGMARVNTGSTRLSLGRTSLGGVRFAAILPARADSVDGLLPARLLGGLAVSRARAGRGQISIF